VSGALELIAPARLGPRFRLLLVSSWVANLGDGAALAAGPLLIAAETRSPFLVAAAALLQRLPWLLFGLHAGAIADRLDRRRLVAAADLTRAAVLVALSATILTGVISIGVVLAAMFAMGLAEVFSITASGTLLPMIVERDDIGVANARLQASVLVGNQLVGPAAGAALFTLGHEVPFLVQAGCVALGAMCVLRIRLTRTRTSTAATHVRAEIIEGIRWLVNHSAMRTLVIVILTFNVTWGAAWSVLVLWAQDRVGLGAFGFGLLTTATAVGGLAATASFGWFDRHVSYGTLMKVCLTTEVLMHAALALTTTAWLALVLMVCFGFYAFIWASVSQTIRQRAVPEDFQGRVGSVNLVGIFGGLVAGQAIGGVIADHAGVVAPFWFAFVGSGLTLALLWRQLGHVVND
jgi:MFS family permease